MIQIENLVKSYDIDEREIEVLKGINLSIDQGKFVSIQGPSGSGKSTLLNMMGGIDRPSSGQIIVNNRNIAQFNDEEMAHYRNKEIGFVFQAFHLEPTYTALENVILPMVFAGVDKKERETRAHQVLDEVGLKDRKDHKPTKLSGGEKQRVCIARAIVNNPGLLLADEPTGNLDTKTGQVIIDLLKRLNQEKDYTIVMVTHDLRVAEQTDGIINLKDGKMTGHLKSGRVG